MNYAPMKTTELKMLWQLVKSGETRPLSAADMSLLLRLRFALQEYEAAVPETKTTESHLTAMTPSVIVEGKR
jgi:hypothetical protein